MDKIKVCILGHNFNGMPIFLARLTQRGHLIKNMDDLLDLYKKCKDKTPSEALLKLPHDTIQRMCHITLAIFGLSTKAVSQLRTHAKRATFISTSTQYSDYSEMSDVFTNPFEPGSAEYKEYQTRTEMIQVGYRNFKDNCKDKDLASYLLPQGLRKCLIIDTNFPGLKKIFQTRLCNRNTKEVQYICQLILQEINDKCGPVWANQCLPKCCSTGCEEGKFCCGNKYQDIRR